LGDAKSKLDCEKNNRVENGLPPLSGGKNGSTQFSWLQWGEIQEEDQGRTGDEQELAKKNNEDMNRNSGKRVDGGKKHKGESFMLEVSING